MRIVEVGPRDGLQNEPAPVPVDARITLIQNLAGAGLSAIECGSFVSPKWVPQMAATASVFEQIQRMPGVVYSALTPNLRGLESAFECRVNEVAVFVSASEAFSQANLNCSITESLQHAEEVAIAAKARSTPVRGYLSCVLGCPFSGDVALAEVVRIAQALRLIGCREISLGDTIGVGTPLQVQKMLDAVASELPIESLAVHFHDTWGQALANILASLELGISVIDSAVAGLGGCPYAPGATGNVATEDVLVMLHGMGIETGVNLSKVAAAGRAISAVLGKRPASKAAQAIAASLA